MIKNRGFFITFEGGEGSGKSLQSRLLYEHLKNDGFDVVLTHEPGGTSGSEEIRNILLKGNIDKWDPTSESLLYLASRSDHWNRLIKPSLDDGKIVISDRFHDSSVVYQGICKNIDISFLDYIYNFITLRRYPDRTYFMKIDPEIGLKRSLGRVDNDETRFENMDISFHKNVLDGFLRLSREFEDRFYVVDGNMSINDIHSEIYDDIIKKI